MLKLSKVALAILIQSVFIIALPIPTSAIVNPDPVLSRKVPPSVVSLHSASDTRVGVPTQFCTGTVIAPTWVITAGHCVFDTDTEEGYNVYATAIVGETRLRVDVVRAVVHPLFQENWNTIKYDVALLELATAIPGVRPMGLVGKSDSAAVLDPKGLILYGWGLVSRGPETEFFDWSNPYILPNRPKAVRQYVDLTPDIWVLPGMHLATLHIDSRGYMQGSCNGDSGGPLVSYRNGVARLVAIVSYGVSDCLATISSANTKLAPVLGWIKTTVTPLVVPIMPDPVPTDEDYLPR